MRACRIAVVVFLVAVVTASGWAQDDASIAAKADAYLAEWASQGRFAGSVLIARGGKVLLRKGYGMANYELEVANSPETVFRVGSITKMFTAFGILQLEERGVLSVNDPVAKHIPELPKGWSAITIHQLLNHTSGIPDFVESTQYAQLGDPSHVESALKAYADKALLNAPGERMRYSNSGYVLLGRILEKVSGQRYEDYLTNNILRPAGMTDTGYDHPKTILKRRASGYTFKAEQVVNADPDNMEFVHSAGALHSTVDDLYRFDRALKSGKLFSLAITSKAWAPSVHVSPTPIFPVDAEYGYGWFSGKTFGHSYVGHSGWVSGFVSQFERYPEDDAVIILLSNMETGNYYVISRDLSAILFGAPYKLPARRTVVHPERKVLERYVGRYQMGPLEVKVTMNDEGTLFAFGTGQRVPYGMIAYSDTEFFFNDFYSEVRFVADPGGKVTQCVVKLGGQEIPLSRVE